jgi:HK97 family phage portal protein
MRNGTFWACVNILSNSVGLLPARLYRRVGETSEPAEGHPVDRLIRSRPNSRLTAFEYKRLIMVHLLCAGNHYSFIRRVAGEVKELIPFTYPRSMSVSEDADRNVTYEYMRPDGRTVRFEASEILHLRALSTDGLLGLSVISAAAQSIGLALQTERYGARLFKQGASPGVILEHPATLSKEAYERLKQSFDEKYSGAENAHKTILLEEGVKASKIGMTSEESQFLETRKYQASDIARFFGIPPHMIGEIDRGTSWGSGIEQQGIGFVTYTLLPWLTNLAQGFDLALLSPEEQERYFTLFDPEPLTRADFKTRQEGWQIMRSNGVLSANEWRRREGLPPRTDPGGDEYSKPGASSVSDSNKGNSDGNPQQQQEEPKERREAA